MSKKDMLAQAAAGFSTQAEKAGTEPKTNTPTPNMGEAENTVEILHDDKPNAERLMMTERRTAYDDRTPNVLTEKARIIANAERSGLVKQNATVKLVGRKKSGFTYRESFQMTVDLGKKMDEYIDSKMLNKSEFIRRAIAHELNRVQKASLPDT